MAKGSPNLPHNMRGRERELSALHDKREKALPRAKEMHENSNELARGLGSCGWGKEGGTPSVVLHNLKLAIC